MKIFGKKKPEVGQPATNAAGDPLISQERRRLSTGVPSVPAGVGGNTTPTAVQLKELAAADLVDASAKRRGSFSICSQTSDNQDSYEDKQTITEGDEVINHTSLKELGIGIRCKKGFKPEAPNQDAFTFVRYEDEFDLLGVFDGHGIYGHTVSQFVREMLPKVFLKDPRRDKSSAQTKAAMIEAFATVQKMIEDDANIDARTSGTTATLAYRPHNSSDMFIAHCGDSRAIMIEEKKGKAVGVELTRDHKPNLPAERQRIENGGGCVIFDGFYNHRVFKRGTVYPGLNMSRAMGDVIGHKEAGITQLPDVKIVSSKGVLGLLICSDGVWEFIDNDEAAQIICSHVDQEKRIEVSAATEALAKESWNRWMEDTGGEIADDITAVLLLFKNNK